MDMSEHTCGVVFDATVPQVALDMSRCCADRQVVFFPVVAQRQIPKVFGIPQLPCILWSMSLLCSCSVYVPVGVQRQVPGGFGVQNTVEVPRWPFLEVLQHPCRDTEAVSHGPVCSADHGNSPVALERGGLCPWYAGRAGRRHSLRGAEAVSHGLADHGNSQLLVDMVSMSLLCWPCRFPSSFTPCRGAEAFYGGPDCSSDQRDFPVALQHGDRCPSCAGRAGFSGRPHSCRDAEAVSHDPGLQLIMEIPKLLVDKVVDLLVTLVVRVPQVLSCRRQSCSHSCTCRETRRVPRHLRGWALHGAAHYYKVMSWGFFRALYTGTGPGTVRDTAPIIRCMRWRLSTKTFVLHPVRTPSSLPHSLPLPSPPTHHHHHHPPP